MTYRHTLRACYMGYFTQAIVNNLAPLLFIIFQSRFSLSFEQLGRLILINFSVQILADIFAARYADRIGYRISAVIAHLFSVAGLVLLAVLPNLLHSHYLGLVIAVVFYALGGGLLEVLLSPIVNALPGEEKDRALTMLHSFYSWGQVCVVLFSTLAIKIAGSQYWPVLPLLWAVIPFLNMFLFIKVPLMPLLPENKRMSLRQLMHYKAYRIALILMFCSASSELVMSQWSSLFAEKGLGLSKIMGDLLGPCLFAVFMGIGRTLYGIFGGKIRLKAALLASSALCIFCYLTTIFSPWPLFGLFGCALCGLSVALMWPGIFSLNAEKFPAGGTILFGMLAIFGDFGGAVGPWLTGLISDAAQRVPALTKIAAATGLNMEQIGLKCGLLVGILFPVLTLIGLAVFKPGAEKSTQDS